MAEAAAQNPAPAQAQEAAQAAQPKAPAKRARPQGAAASGAPKRRSSKKVERLVLVKSGRKTAVARATVKKGTGIIRVNGFDISTMEPVELRSLMTESLHISSITEEFAKGVDISVNVRGGGQSGQAQAVRGAIAKGISEFSESDVIRSECMSHDRSLLVDDSRRVEPKKFLGTKARARFQKSYR
jgi:small subunit ribosomal protein S9